MISRSFTAEAIKELSNEVDELRSNVKKLPVKVNVNEKWLDEMIGNKVIFQEGPTEMFQLGLPVYIDNSIDTFEFIYPEEE